MWQMIVFGPFGHIRRVRMTTRQYEDWILAHRDWPAVVVGGSVMVRRPNSHTLTWSFRPVTV